MTIHIATPAEIGGSIDDSEVLVFHRTGPLAGMTLAVKSSDPTLMPALAAGEVVLEGGAPRLLAQVVTASLVELMVVGQGFTDQTIVDIPGASVTGVTVTPTSVAFDCDLTGKTGLLQVVLTNPAAVLMLRVV